MTRDYAISPTIEHYTCMVDLARSGQIERAIRILKLMPYEPHAELWRCVLGAFRKWNVGELGRHAFECAVMLDKNDAAAYHLMASIYVDAHMHEERKEIQAMRRKAQAWKTRGQSWWTRIDGAMHTFVVEDRDHPKLEQVYAKLGDTSAHAWLVSQPTHM